VIEFLGSLFSVFKQILAKCGRGDETASPVCQILRRSVKGFAPAVWKNSNGPWVTGIPASLHIANYIVGLKYMYITTIIQWHVASHATRTYSKKTENTTNKRTAMLHLFQHKLRPVAAPKILKRGGGRDNFFSPRPHLLQMHATMYMPFTRKKAALKKFWAI